MVLRFHCSNAQNCFEYKKTGGFNMKQKSGLVFFAALVFAASLMATGCASGPKLGTPTALQEVLNKIPAIPVLGKDVKFEFGGDTWISTVDGKDFLAGTFVSEDNDSGSILTLKQTHLYSDEQKPQIGGDVGWIKTPGPEIVLEYTKGPPAALSVKK
jgi:hypothetical protein